MIKDKVVVITGASSGIGEAVGKALALKGAKVVLGARRTERLQKIVTEIENNGGQAVYHQTDVTSNQEMEALVKKAIDTFGRVDVLLNNAGIMPQSLLSAKKIGDWDNMIDINIKGTLYGIGAVLPYMNEQKSGQIINISSVAGHYAHVGGAVYSATKWAVRAISESLREEMAQAENNVRVTIISPGAIQTDLLSSVTDDQLKENFEKFYENYGISVERVVRTIEQAIDLPEDTTWNEVIIRPTKQVQ